MAPKKNDAKAPSPEPDEAEEKEDDEPEEQKVGDFVFPNGSTYKGQYIQKGVDRIVRIIHGTGELSSGPGAENFVGTFERGSYKKGSYTGCNGAQYTGTFKDNVFHGSGEYRWPDGRSYKGLWKDGKMHGRGQFKNFSFGADQTKEGFSYNGEFASSYAKQQEIKAKFLNEYGEDYKNSAIAFIEELIEKGDDALKEPKVLRRYLVPQPEEDVEETPEDKEARKEAEQFFDGRLPWGEAAPLAIVQQVAKGIKPNDEGVVTTVVKLLETASEATCFEAKRFKKDAREQLQHVGQCVEFSTVDGPAPRLALLNISTEFECDCAKWKIVYLEEPPPPA